MARFVTAPARAFAEHWFSLPRAGVMPSLADFLDRPHPVLQPMVAITDVFSDTEIRYRLVGTALVYGFGRERTGHNILEVTAPALRPELAAWFKRIVEHPCGARSMVTAATSRGREASFETVCFPLSRDDHPPVVIGYNETITPLEEDEHVVQFLAMHDSEWIELT